jgi:hypothetical protein
VHGRDVMCALTTFMTLKCTPPFSLADCDRSRPFDLAYSFPAGRYIFEPYLDISGAMGSPYHVSQCPSHLLSCDKASFEFQAISLIAESFAHPQRTLLSTFIQGAVDREFAARFFLDNVARHEKANVAEFLVDWISLLRRGMSSSSSLNYTDRLNSTSDRL